MSAEQPELSGRDLGQGIPFTELADGEMRVGHAQGKAVLVARQGDEVFAIGAYCTHYGAPLVDGLLVGDAVRCPWHHACFSLRTGEAVCAPALNPVARWITEQRAGMIYVTDEMEPADGATPVLSGARASFTPTSAPTSTPTSVVIVGAGAAGNAAAEMLRREGYTGPVTLIGGEASVPYDRPNLSKDYLAGSAPEEWIPLRSVEFYRDHDIELVLGNRVTAIDADAQRVHVDDGRTFGYGALLLATGAEPVHLPRHVDPGNRVHYLRTLADSRAIISATESARSAVVLGASFIGLEVAASLRARGIEVHVVAPEARPLERVLGRELGDFIRRLHEDHGVIFHFARTASNIGEDDVTLGSGERLSADLVVAGIGVRPNLALAQSAGLVLDRGVLVSEFLETSVPGVFAAGDIAQYPDRYTAEHIRVEHWVVAERQGQTAA
ncbi:MAG: FAD-dependent oxidoreductase, partial [Gemmatimonadaceae bacterium]